ncbi:MAG TPA: hypothetical protein VGH19_17610 [Verrucomicrobiae bacterium]
MEPSTQTTGSWLRRHRLAVFGWGGILLFILLLLAFSLFQRHRTQGKINTKLAAIRTQNLPTNLAELDTFYTHIPDADNGTVLLLQYRNHYVEWDEIYAPWIGDLSSNSVMYVTNPITPAARAILQGIIVSNQTALRLIYDAVAKPKWRYPVDLNQGATNLLPDLIEPKKITKLLRVESLHHLAEGRHSAALKSIGVSFQVSDSLAGEPTLISFLVRNACLSVSESSLEMLLQRDGFPSPDLASLQQMIADSESKTDLLRILHGERTFIIGSWHEPAGQQLFTSSTPFDTWPPPLQKFGWAVYESGGAKSADLLNFLYICEELEAILKLDPMTALQQTRTLEDRFIPLGKPSMDMIATAYLTPIMLSMVEKHAGLITRLRITQTALAIERFRMENKSLPKKLGELTPQYLKAPLLDPFTQSPLLYRITKKGFRVYSTGENAQDDGGFTRSEKETPENDDIVFTVERTSAR